MTAVGRTEEKRRGKVPKHWIRESTASGDGVEGAPTGTNGLQGGLKYARTPGVCKTWVSNTWCVLQEEFLSTWGPAASPGIEPGNYSLCRAMALL